MCGEKEGWLQGNAVPEACTAEVNVAVGRVVQLDPVGVCVGVCHRATIGGHQLVENDTVRQALHGGVKAEAEGEVPVIG